MSLKIRINKVNRVTADGVVETIELLPGVNILEGPPNSGKTVWLNIIDFLFGDTGPIEDVLAQEDIEGKKLFEKYIAASMNVTIGDKEINIERKWTEQGTKSKVFINDSPIPAQDFSDYILKELQIPVLHFPKGNPFTDRAWPSLSWRMMLRHIYRKEKLWSDLADKQPDSEQHAVLAQFLGIVEIFEEFFNHTVLKRRIMVYNKDERKYLTCF